MNESDNVSVNESDNVSVNESDNVNVNESDNDSDDDDDNDHDEQYNIIKQLNNYFQTIDKTKLLKEQIEILKKKKIS